MPPDPATFPEPIQPTGMLAPGSYPWDHWERAALAGGLARELATLGRAVMREASQHCWCERLQAECGWCDGGRAMFHCGLQRHRRPSLRDHGIHRGTNGILNPW